MGTVLEFSGVKVRVLGNDHNPPHCHAYRGACTARYNLVDMEWMSYEGFTRADLALIEEQIKIDREPLMQEWERQNGKQ